MTQEEKQILLVDLCARLPYGVKITDGLHITTLKVRIYTAPATLAQFIHSESLKYYLRPMSSMTEKEINEFHKLRFRHINYGSEPLQCVLSIDEIEWLNQHHFDYRDLIGKGLAIEAPKDMYNTKTE